jgi:sugar fermentation stimulation protein A
VERPNRFLVRARLEAEPGESKEGVVEAHLPDPGRLRELLLPDVRLWLEPARNPERRTRWTLRLCEQPGGGGVVSLDTTLPNRLVEAALRGPGLPELQGWELVRSEATVGASRFDFLLVAASSAEPRMAPGREMVRGPGNDGPAEALPRLLLEVKSVTLVEDRIGLFPDAVTARGARHVRELAELVEEGWEAAVLFVLQRDDADEIRAAAGIDPAFARALADAEAAGVRVLGRRCRVTREGVALGDPVAAGFDLDAASDPANGSDLAGTSEPADGSGLTEWNGGSDMGM